MFKHVTSLVRSMQDGVRSRKFEIRRTLDEPSSGEHDVTQTKMNVAANFFGDWRRAAEFFQELNDTFRAGNCDGLRKSIAILEKRIEMLEKKVEDLIEESGEARPNRRPPHY